jgi:hypothetical protein
MQLGMDLGDTTVLPTEVIQLFANSKALVSNLILLGDSLVDKH